VSPWAYVVAACLGLCVLSAIGAALMPSSKPAPARIGSSPTTQEPVAETAIPISTTALVSAYDSNEVAADERYKGKLLIVTGTVENVAKDILGNLYVVLRGGHIIRSVQCYFGDEHTEELANLSKGSRVRIKGRCDGLLMNVLLKDCALVN